MRRELRLGGSGLLFGGTCDGCRYPLSLLLASLVGTDPCIPPGATLELAALLISPDMASLLYR
jgi:hypothetical protein